MHKFTFVLLISLFSCSQNTLPITTKEMEFKTKEFQFTIDAPLNWEYIKEQGIDSYVGKIYVGQKDTIYFDLGYFSNDLEHSDLAEELGIDEELIQTRKTYESINGLNAKFVLHRYKKLNDFGIYFDSLWTDYHKDVLESKDIVKFNIYCKNISDSVRSQIENTFRTLKFLKFN